MLIEADVGWYLVLIEAYIGWYSVLIEAYADLVLIAAYVKYNYQINITIRNMYYLRWVDFKVAKFYWHTVVIDGTMLPALWYLIFKAFFNVQFNIRLHKIVLLIDAFWKWSVPDDAFLPNLYTELVTSLVV